METVQQLARHESPRGVLVLQRRCGPGGAVDELIVNGAFAMDSVETETERRLGELAVSGGRRRILVGGLGLGYTAAAVLAAPVESVDVVELEDGLVAAARSGATPTLAAVATDRRVRLQIGDIRAVLTGESGPYGPWDAIVLDVDNGPDFLIHPGNDALYTEATLRAAYARLTPGGSLAVWCQGPAPALLSTLARIGPDPLEHTYAVSRGDRCFTYAIYELVRPAGDPDRG